jgi:hypothetical protein
LTEGNLPRCVLPVRDGNTYGTNEQISEGLGVDLVGVEQRTMNGCPSNGVKEEKSGACLAMQVYDWWHLLEHRSSQKDELQAMLSAFKALLKQCYMLLIGHRKALEIAYIIRNRA